MKSSDLQRSFHIRALGMGRGEKYHDAAYKDGEQGRPYRFFFDYKTGEVKGFLYIFRGEITGTPSASFFERSITPKLVDQYPEIRVVMDCAKKGDYLSSEYKNALARLGIDPAKGTISGHTTGLEPDAYDILHTYEVDAGLDTSGKLRALKGKVEARAAAQWQREEAMLDKGLVDFNRTLIRPMFPEPETA
jgi:hypothetical protein